MTRTARPQQGYGWPLATATKTGLRVCQAAFLLLTCTFAALHHTAVEGRSLTASRPGPCTFRRQALQSVDLPAVEQGWTLGRASYFNPPDAFNEAFRSGMSPFKGAAPNGDCGWWNGANRTDLSASLVPADMVAALATTNTDYPGSCGRCYELRCVNNVVPGNYTIEKNGPTPTPYLIEAGQLRPVYDFPTISPVAPLDGYNRTFPGNVLDASKMLFTQCWNQTATDPPDLQVLSLSGSIIVQVADTCHCQKGSTDDACCTNIPQFNLGYQAFQKLAHPDYGLMNLIFRPVDCSTHAALPVQPGFIDKTIYKDQLGTGWGVGTSGSAVRRLQQPQNGLSNSNASCFDLQKAEDELYFFCRDCDRPSYQPFLLSNTSGLEFYIKQTRDMSAADVQVPSLTMTMGYENITRDGKLSYTQLCNGGTLDSPQFAALGKNDTGLRRVTVLFQNSLSSCISMLDQVTSFRFQSTGATSRVSFCLDDITLLPSTLQPAESESPMPNHPNCVLADPQPIDQEGRYIAGLQTQTNQNLSGYIVFPFTDLQNNNDMNPLLGTCFANTTGLNITLDMVQQVNDCAANHTLCCYSAGSQESGLPDTLAQICNSMATNGSICQGFVYDSSTSTAFFKGAPQTESVDPSNLCLHPTDTVWLLNTALPPVQPDNRAIATTTLESAKPACNLPFNQDLQMLARDNPLPEGANHGVPGNGSVPAYTLFPHADLQSTQGKLCSVSSGNATTAAAVRTCSSIKNGACCVNYDQQLSSTAVDSSMPEILTSICNDIKFTADANISADCQGFVYDSKQKIVFFKPQPASRLLDTSDLCSNPTTYTWLLAQLRGPAGAIPPTISSQNSGSNTGLGDKAKTAWGVVVGVLGASVTGFGWLAITYSYRMEKHMVVTEVMRNLKVADIASEAQSAQAATTQQETPISNIPLAAPAVQSRNLQRIRSAPSRGGLSLQGSRSMRSSRLMLPSTQSSSLQSSNSDAVQNPLLRALGLSFATASFQRTNSNMHLDTMSGPSKEMKTVAKQITVRCLRRWDGFLGIRASSDGLGRRSGIWRDKFDGVHYAVLLLAMHRLNETLSIAAQEPSCILEAWQHGDRAQRHKLLDQLVRVLQNVSEEEAQALPDKDPERPGIYDRVCSMMVCCGA